jgi:hypothetical protein
MFHVPINIHFLRISDDQIDFLELFNVCGLWILLTNDQGV